MPWDFFCPVCSNILDADMTDDPVLMAQQWKILQNDFFLCDQCNNVVSFNHNIIDINTLIPNSNTFTIHVTIYPFFIKGHLIDHPGIYKIDNIFYKIV